MNERKQVFELTTQTITLEVDANAKLLGLITESGDKIHFNFNPGYDALMDYSDASYKEYAAKIIEALEACKKAFTEKYL